MQLKDFLDNSVYAIVVCDKASGNKPAIVKQFFSQQPMFSPWDDIREEYDKAVNMYRDFGGSTLPEKHDQTFEFIRRTSWGEAYIAIVCGTEKGLLKKYSLMK